MSKPKYRESGAYATAQGRLKAAILKFVECINAGDPSALMAHQTDDFTFIDMSGNVFTGRQGWEDYFASYPDYKIHVDRIVTGGDGVAIIGRTTGSHVAPNVEEYEAVLWTAEIRDGLVAEWRIYTDLEDAKRKAEEASGH
ncbi:nuclear transport factor 2 family protein [Candidatus Bathyarchaeota archaeon]|nr:nuclear transport factor 2 family protein [Candidatus Bathyarchaeota archaeon]